MASLKDIKRRIGSVKSSQKITNAMKLVSASKFARALQSIHSAKPYSQSLNAVVGHVLGGIGDDVTCFLNERVVEKKILVVIIGSDRGLCGPLNTYIFKLANQFIAEKTAAGCEISLTAWGRRAIQYVGKKDFKVVSAKEKILADISPLNSKKLAEDLIFEFREKNADAVYVIYPKFKSAMEQIPTVVKLMPFDKDLMSLENVQQSNASALNNSLFEPPIATMLEPLLRRWLSNAIFRILLESAASEHGARMSAMENATKNAKEVSRKLTLVYNRVRQAAITTELIEIISGAEALN